METILSYKVYELNRVMDSSEHLALEEVRFKGFVHNDFKTEEDAIQALIKDKMTYENYLILRSVYLRD